MPRVLITGATGFVGRSVTARFLAEGWSVTALSRDPATARALPAGVNLVAWDPRAPRPQDLPRVLDAVVHLAGASIAGGRWTPARKRKLRDSRVEATRALVDALETLPAPPRAFVSASGMGYFGDAGDRHVFPAGPPGDDFLGRLAAAWEAEAQRAAHFGARVARVRLGMVLGGSGGALPKMALPFRFGAGAVFGSGAQYAPWIHRDDAVELFFRAATDATFTGPVHGVAGDPVTHGAFMKMLAETLRRPLLFRIPAAVLRFGFGEMADLFLHGQRAEPDGRLTYSYTTLESALHAVFPPP